ncbi:MAG: PadR family transcriptional regulator [Cyanobacteria bacterium SIG28]|nr:PadR family transcriptional regulator [Cyanobacteria bacterium SIG28]
MIELLILYELNKKVLTMYGISKEIHAEFSVLTTPSYGTIKPALTRLEKSGFVKTQKNMSVGGRPSTYYSITREGKEELVNLELSQLQDNPIQFLPTARIRLACADVLKSEEQKLLFKLLKQKTETIIVDTKNIMSNKQDFYPKMVYDNLICEYNNFLLLLEGFERACKN